jgi:hypothetical protein
LFFVSAMEDGGKGLEGRVMNDLPVASQNAPPPVCGRASSHHPSALIRGNTSVVSLHISGAPKNNVHRSPDRSRNFRNKSIHSANTPWIHSKKPYFYTPSDMLKNMPSVRHG